MHKKSPEKIREKAPPLLRAYNWSDFLLDEEKKIKKEDPRK
jgi:hypothetical protein